MTPSMRNRCTTCSKRISLHMRLELNQIHIATKTWITQMALCASMVLLIRPFAWVAWTASPTGCPQLTKPPDQGAQTLRPRQPTVFRR